MDKLFFLVFCAIMIFYTVSADIATNSISRKTNSFAKNNPVNIIESLRKQIEAKEKELERAERTNKNFEKMIELVNILGQVDTFLTDRTRAIIKKLAVLTEDSNDIIVAKRSNKTGASINLQLPIEPCRKEKWMQILSLVKNPDNQTIFVCSLHFLDRDFEINSSGRFVLKRDSIPSVNLDLDLLGNTIAKEYIRKETDTICAGTLRRNDSEHGIISVNTDKDFSLNFLSALKEPFLFKELCKSYVCSHIPANLNDKWLEDFIVAAKKKQQNILTNVSLTMQRENCNFKHRLYLFCQEEKNRTYTRIKTSSFGRCRLCLHRLQKSNLLLFSTWLGEEKDVTIKDCLTSLLPSFASNFKLNHEICLVCYKHLLTTLHFFKMAMAVEGILSTVLNDQPFIFNEEKEPNDNTFPSCLERIVSNNSLNLNYSEDSNEHPFTLDDDYTNLNTENAANQCFQQNQEISNLDQMQKDVLNKFLPDLLSIKSKDSTKFEIFGGDLQETNSSNNYMCINNIQELNTDNTISNTMPLNNEIKVEPDYESFDHNNTEQSDKEIFNIQNDVNESDLFAGVKKEDSKTDTPDLNHVDLPLCTYQAKSNSDIYNDLKLDNSSKNKLPALKYSLNLSDHTYYALNNSNNDDANSTSEHFNHDVLHPKHLNSDLNMTLAPSEESRNESVIESTIRNDLDEHENLQCLPLFFTITSAVSNPEDFIADCPKELKVISLDFNMAKEKRIIFIGSKFCKNCKKSKPSCNCWVKRKKGGMCEKCGKIIAHQDRLRKHLTKCQKIYTCEKCNSVFSTEYMYKRHLKNIADAPVCNYLQCKLCSVKFTKTDFKEHIKEHPNHLCSKCGRSFATTSELHSHSKRHRRKTNSEKMELVCHLCGKQCFTVPNLKHHINTHTRKKTETCEICKKMYYSVSDVQKHMRSFHSGEEYACNICNKKFSSKPGLKNHVVVVHMRKPVETCKICNIQFARRDYYQFHVSRYHSSKFPHVPAPKPQKKPRKLKNIPAICTICERVFKNRATLRVHITSCHAHASRIKCRQCHMTFCSPASRARHEKLHENPYYKFGCKICFARNKSEKELQEHMKKSHSKKPKAIYQCYQCNEKFCRKYLLMVHIGNVHTPQNTEEVMDHIENNHIPQNTEEVKTKIDELTY